MSGRFYASYVTSRSALALLIAAVLLAPARAAGQAPSAAKDTQAGVNGWTPPRTPDGQPDLQGIWTNATIIPLQRPSEFEGKEVLTEQEAIEYEKRIFQQWDRDRRDGTAAADLARAYGSVWWDADAKIVPTRRTSLIVDPPDGRIPPLTSEAEARIAYANAVRQQRQPTHGPEDRGLIERCLWWMAAGPPMLPSFANNSPFSTLVSNYQFVQVPGYFVIVNEILHQTRIIPLDGRPHLSRTIREWMGDSRGRWEGNTLIVETTNFIDRSQFRGSGKDLHLVEHFTPTGPDSVLYEFTVNDPTTWTRPWTARVPMMKSQGPIFEWACHEGNYGLAHILSAARAEERGAAEAARK